MPESELAAIRHLREVLKGLVKLKRGEHKPECHCEFCVAEHALAVTSGYEERKKRAVRRSR